MSETEGAELIEIFSAKYTRLAPPPPRIVQLAQSILRQAEQGEIAAIVYMVIRPDGRADAGHNYVGSFKSEVILAAREMADKLEQSWRNGAI